MKHSLFAVLALLISAVFTPAHAGTHKWTGGQILTVLGGELECTDGVGARASLHVFHVPKTGFAPKFVYAGPTFSTQVGDVGVWISPQVAAFLGWFNEADAYGVSVWASVTRNNWSLFLEGDYVVSEYVAAEVFYGYYALDHFSTKGVVNLGFQVEQVGIDIDYGPHVGFAKDVFRLEFQYYMDVEDGNVYHAARTVFGLGF